jgi:hypothetical protein
MYNLGVAILGEAVSWRAVTIEVNADVLDTAMLGSRFMRWRMTLCPLLLALNGM